MKTTILRTLRRVARRRRLLTEEAEREMHRGGIERRGGVGLGARRRDRVAEAVVNRRNQDANNMMHAFLAWNRPARKTSYPRRGSLPGLAASIPFIGPR